MNTWATQKHTHSQVCSYVVMYVTMYVCIIAKIIKRQIIKQDIYSADFRSNMMHYFHRSVAAEKI